MESLLSFCSRFPLSESIVLCWTRPGVCADSTQTLHGLLADYGPIAMLSLLLLLLLFDHNKYSGTTHH